MRTYILSLLCAWLVSPVMADEPCLSGNDPAATTPDSFHELLHLQPKLLRITATMDGSGKLVFTRQAVRYEHKHWDPPTNVVFEGEPWTDLSRTPAAWLEAAAHLDLTKAWIVKRKGRDTIALESISDGFDLHLCDAPDGAAEYEVVIAIPRRP